MADLYAGPKSRSPANMGSQIAEIEVEPNPFEQLVELVRDNDELLIEFQRLRSQAAAAMRYLAKPRANSRIAGLWLERLRLRRRVVLNRWDENHRRLWALGLLDGSESQANNLGI